MRENNYTMWYTNAENPKSIEGIYGGEEPSLNDSYISNIEFENGKNPDLLISIQIKNFPSSPPAKWLEKGYDSVIISLRLMNLKSFHFTGSFELERTDIYIVKSENDIRLRTANGVIQLECSWLYIDSVSGYTLDEP